MALLVGWLDAAIVGTCGVLLLVFVSRRVHVRPAIRHLLWLVIALRFLIPSGQSWSWSPWETPLSSVSARVSLALPAVPEEAGDVAGSDGTTATTTATYPTSRTAAPSPGTLLLAAWLASALFVLLVRLGRYRNWRNAVERDGATPSDLREDLREVAGMMGAKPPRVVLSARATSPMIVGCRSPILVWPATDPGLSRAGRRMVLAHELAHLRRGDPWLGWIGLLVRALWWWYPPARLAQAEMSRSAEEACDDWAVSLFPDERRSYAEALCAVAAATSPTGAPALTTPISGLDAMKRRVTGIVRHRHEPHPGRTGYGAALIAAVAVLPLSTFSPTRDAPDPPAERSFDMAGLIGRGAVELDPDGQPVVGPGSWMVGFRAMGEELRVVFATPGENLVLEQTGRTMPLDAANRSWLTQIADSTEWSVDPRRPWSASGAFVPDGPHMHRPTERATLAVWSGVPEPFTTDGSLNQQASLDHSVIVLMWSETMDGARLYRLWRDEAGTPTGEIFDGAGRRTLREVDRLVETIAFAVGARD